jgi:hypothetical protein
VSLPPLTGGSLCLAFSPDGQVLATLDQTVRATRSLDNEVEPWNVADPQTPAAVATTDIPLAPDAGEAALSPDTSLLAVADAGEVSSREAAELWNLSDSQRPDALWYLAAPGGTVAMASDGPRRLLAVGGGGVVVLWDITNLAHPARITQFTIGRKGDTEPDIDVAFSPGGTMLAALATGDGTIWRWSLDNLSHIVPLSRLTGAPYGLISVGTDGEVVSDTLDGLPEGSSSQTAIWDLRSARGSQPIAHLPQPVGDSTATAIDPAAPILATGDANSNVHLWNVSDPRNPSTVGAFAVPRNSLLLGVSLPLNASGSRYVETVAGDPQDRGFVSLWEINANSLIGGLCAGTGDAITPAQWSQYLPGQPYRPPCEASV